MDPRGIEWIFAIGNLQEPRCLDKRALTDSRDLFQLFARCKWTVLATIFVQSPRRQLIQAGDIAQQRRARRVDVDPDVVHARVNDRVQGRLKRFTLHVVLVQPNANIGRIDLDQLGQRVQQSSANRNGATNGGVVVLKDAATEYFLASEDEYIFSFHSVCDFLSVDPNKVLIAAGLLQKEKSKTVKAKESKAERPTP